MGKHIHTRIFLLVLAVILFLTLGAGLIFSASSARYVEYAARRDGEAMISMVEKIVKDMCWKETGRQSAKEEREGSKRILQKVKETIKEEAFDGKLLVFNSKYRLVYPETYEEGELPDALTQRCQEILKQGGNVRPERVQIENKSWNLQCFTLDTVHSVRAKYFIAAVPAPDMDIFWDAVRQLMWGGPDRCGSCCIRTGLADFKEHFQAAAKALQSDSNGGRGAQRTDQRDLFAFGTGNPETVL